MTPTTKSTGKPGDEYTQQVVRGFHEEVTALIGDSQGNIWVGTYNNGLCWFTGTTSSCWSTKQGLPDNSVRSLYEDDEQNLWVGFTSGGLERWRIATLLPLRDEPHAMRDVQSAAILTDHRGRLVDRHLGQGALPPPPGEISSANRCQGTPAPYVPSQKMRQGTSGSVPGSMGCSVTTGLPFSTF